MTARPDPTAFKARRTASDASYADALAQVRREAQSRYTRDYGHPSALYSEKGPFK